MRDRLILGLLAFAAIIPRTASGHGGNPAVADIIEPTSLCPIADVGRTLKWNDADAPAPSGPSFVDLYATRIVPPTFTRDVFPDVLEDHVVELGIPEADRSNTLTWETSTVATGVYWIWSRVREPPEEMSAQLIGLSPVPIVVHHEGDPIPSAIAITRPNTAFGVADQQYRIEYETLDPTGQGRVRLEARPFLEDDWHVIADRLPAAAHGEFIWNTSSLPTGDWIMRATLDDCLGTQVVTHTRFIFNVSHPGRPALDAGWDLDAGQVDAVVPDWCDEPPADAGLAQCGVTVTNRDAGVAIGPEPNEPDPTGCNCRDTKTLPATSWPWLLVVLLAAARQRRCR